MRTLVEQRDVGGGHCEGGARTNITDLVVRGRAYEDSTEVSSRIPRCKGVITCLVNKKIVGIAMRRSGLHSVDYALDLVGSTTKFGHYARRENR